MGKIDDDGQFDLRWKDLMRSPLGDDIEDAMLAAAAEFERENPKSEPPRPTWGEVRRAALNTGTAIEYLTPLDDTTEMRYFKAVSEDGTKIEGFVPVELPDDGVKVKVNGVPGVLYLHPDGEVHLDETQPAEEDEVGEAVTAHLMEMSKIETKIVGYSSMQMRQFYGVSLTDEFVLSLLEAWEHVDHEGSECKAIAETYLTRFVQQFIGSLHIGNARKDNL